MIDVVSLISHLNQVGGLSMLYLLVRQTVEAKVHTSLELKDLLEEARSIRFSKQLASDES